MVSHNEYGRAQATSSFTLGFHLLQLVNDLLRRHSGATREVFEAYAKLRKD